MDPDPLWLIVLPAPLAAVAMVATRPWRRGRDLGGWGAAVAISGSFIVAFYGLFGSLPPFPPVSAQQWLVLLCVPVVLIAVAQGMVRSIVLAIAGPVVVLGVTPWLLLRKVSFVEPRVLWAWMIGGGVAMVAWWAAMELLARRGRGASLPLVLAIACAVAGMTIIDANSALLGQAAGALAVPLLVIAAAAAWSRGASMARGGMLSVALLLPGLLLVNYFFANLALRDLVLLSAAPLAAWAGEVPKLGPADSCKRFAVRAAAVLVILALPAVESARGLTRTLREQTDPYSYPV